jgi:isoleucyl-tRNA synthetase
MQMSMDSALPKKKYPMAERQEIDRWIISLLNSLVKEVAWCYENYEPTRAGRAISEFVSENLSNWFVRLSRKRYWGGEFTDDKISAYQTLYTCLETVAKLMAPIAPFYADLLYTDLNKVSQKEVDQSVHLADFPSYNEKLVDNDLEDRMNLAQKASSMVLALRRKEKLKVRQPLARIIVPVLNQRFREQFEAIKNIVLTEVNVKEVEFLTDTTGIIKKKIKPDFKVLGPKYGKLMKEIAGAIGKFGQKEIVQLESAGQFEIQAGSEKVIIKPEDIEIHTEDIPGWTVASEGQLTVALDINVTEELKDEGFAREFINKIQNIRKDSNFEVTDRINLTIVKGEEFNKAILNYKDYICAQTLANQLELVDNLNDNDAREVEIDKDLFARIIVKRAEN